MQKKTNKLLIILVLFFIFLAPGITALIAYKNPKLLGSSRVNRGDLVETPIPLTSLGNHGKWSILLFSPEICEDSCLKQLDVLTRIRLALGRKLYQVDLGILFPPQQLDTSPMVKSFLKDHQFQMISLNTSDEQQIHTLKNARIFIANKNGLIILSYPFGVKPIDVYKDLKQLLSVSEKMGV